MQFDCQYTVISIFCRQQVVDNLFIGNSDIYYVNYKFMNFIIVEV